MSKKDASKSVEKKAVAPKKAAKKVPRPMSDHVPAVVLATPAPFTGAKRLVKKAPA